MNEHSLYQKYPYLFEGTTLPKSKSPMAYGMQIGEGWTPIVERLSAELTELFPKVQYFQIKEKFGVLRVYVNLNGEDFESIYNLIDKYVIESKKVCEICGADGVLRTDRKWIQTLCDEHNTEGL